MERADFRQKQIDDMEAWCELEEAEYDLRMGIAEDVSVCVIEGEVIEGTHVLIAAA